MAITDKDIQKLKKVFPTKDDIRSIVKTEVRSIVKTEVRAVVREELEELHTKVDLIDGKVDDLDAKIDQTNSKLGAFENNEVDKRQKLEVRVTKVEQKLGMPTPDQTFV